MGERQLDHPPSEGRVSTWRHPHHPPRLHCTFPAQALSSASPAHAARSGGRVGGAAFSSYGGARVASSGYAGASRGGSYWSASPSSVVAPTRTAPPPTTMLRSSIAPLGWGIIPYGVGPVVVAGGGGGGGGLADILTLGVFAFIAWTALKAFTQASSADDDYAGGFDDGTDRVSVCRLTVGLLATGGRKLQKDLDRLAAKANTSTPSGLHYVLQEVILALLRNPEYAVYGAAKSQIGRSVDGAERKFNSLSLKERGKIKTETLVNFGGQPTRSGGLATPPTRSGDQEFVVVTLLLACRGAVRLPRVTGGEELASALGALGGVPASDVLAVEVLWTPQDPADTYTRADVTTDYPELNNL